MTTEQNTAVANQTRHLYIDDPNEAKEISRANNRYGMSWFLGIEAAERSIAVANNIKSWLCRAKQGGIIPPLVLVDDQVDYVLQNLERASDNLSDPHSTMARTVLESIVYIEPATLPIAQEPNVVRLSQAS